MSRTAQSPANFVAIVSLALMMVGLLLAMLHTPGLPSAMDKWPSAVTSVVGMDKWPSAVTSVVGMDKWPSAATGVVA